MPDKAPEYGEQKYELRIERLNGNFVGISRTDNLDDLKETAEFLVELGFCARIVMSNKISTVVEKFYAEPHYWEDKETS
jgi:hypothetical protein